jgi:hypothetical protein
MTIFTKDRNKHSTCKPATENCQEHSEEKYN